MTTTSLPASNSTQIAGRFCFALMLLANAVRMSWEDGRASSFDVVLWTALVITGLYGCTLLASALAESLLRLLGTRDDWPRMREAARRFVERERNWGASVARYGPVFEALERAR